MQIPIFDTHAHLCDSSFDADCDAVLKRAQEAGVDSILIVGENLEDGHRNMELVAAYGCLKAAVGLYPEYAALLSEIYLQLMVEYLSRDNEEMGTFYLELCKKCKPEAPYFDKKFRIYNGSGRRESFLRNSYDALITAMMNAGDRILKIIEIWEILNPNE